MKYLKCAIGASALVCANVAAAEYEGPGVAGVIDEDTTWAGEVYLAGDLRIAPNATLTVEPGTRVTVSREDALSGRFVKHGTNYDVEVVVAGALKINGAQDAPVVFIPEADGTPDETWSGFKLKKGGTLEASNAWFVGNRWRLPSRAALEANVYHAGHARRTGDVYWPASGLDAHAKAVYFYPDGAVIPKEAIKANRGYSRWIIAPSLALGTFFAVFLVTAEEGFAGYKPKNEFVYNLRWAIPAGFFAIGYLAGSGIDNLWGARRVQNKWLEEHPAFTPPF
jgi:hypothetical protein